MSYYRNQWVWFFLLFWIRICMEPELLPKSGSGIIVTDPAKYERADTVNKNVISF